MNVDSNSATVCNYCSCQHSMSSVARRKFFYPDPVRQSKKNVREACEASAACGKAIANIYKIAFERFVYEDDFVKFRSNGTLINVMLCTGMKHGKAIDFEALRREITSGFREKCVLSNPSVHPRPEKEEPDSNKRYRPSQKE